MASAPEFRLPSMRDWLRWLRREAVSVVHRRWTRSAPTPVQVAPPRSTVAEKPTSARTMAPPRFTASPASRAAAVRLRRWVEIQPPGSRITLSDAARAVPGVSRGLAWRTFRRLSDDGVLRVETWRTQRAERQIWIRR
ncbi:Flagellar motor rotation protein MotB [Candidatus Hydrogenisulfobacillus filiaventi]|uniref:Flagellar motor rotation protein MotB n=1 Tax=Candidatus Hydrogenisulfobacillus filiaventi TaxID=2707344 RepID=A0A6F8ZHZ9_9FIRM|nr:Flagellar motor rotation protein MotB [Candidatus Hydrogenisulfobacillus filiaventi]